MNVFYLGTAAAEGIPAPFCCCDICREAARRGGKDLRMRTGMLVMADPGLKDYVTFHVLKPFDTVDVEGIRVTARNARRSCPGSLLNVLERARPSINIPAR